MIRRRHIAGAVAHAATTVGCGAPGQTSTGRPRRSGRGSATPALRHVVTGDAVRTRQATRRAWQRAARRKAGYLTLSDRAEWLPAVEVRPRSTLSSSNSGRFLEVYDQHDLVAVTSIAHAASPARAASG